jgi:hypothetical protein
MQTKTIAGLFDGPHQIHHVSETEIYFQKHILGNSPATINGTLDRITGIVSVMAWPARDDRPNKLIYSMKLNCRTARRIL